MPNFEIDIHAAKLVELPLVRRLTERSVLLDSELLCTGETGDLHELLLSRIMPRSLVTLVGRANRQPIIGQFRLKPEDHLAQIVSIAPGIDEPGGETAWLHMIDAMTLEAGRRGAHMLAAEVDEQHPAFETMRQAGFAVYARQEIWRRANAANLPAAPIALAEETDDDALDIQLLYSNIVPRFVQPIAVPPRESTGLVYRENGRVKGYIALCEGKAGIYLMPFLHPDIFSQAPAIIAGAMTWRSRAERMPVFVCVRRYQDWLEEALTELGFESGLRQAVMVRHIAAGIRQASFTPAVRQLEVIPSMIRPPTTRIHKVGVVA